MYFDTYFIKYLLFFWNLANYICAIPHEQQYQFHFVLMLMWSCTHSTRLYPFIIRKYFCRERSIILRYLINARANSPKAHASHVVIPILIPFDYRKRDETNWKLNLQKSVDYHYKFDIKKEEGNIELFVEGKKIHFCRLNNSDKWLLWCKTVSRWKYLRRYYSIEV